MGTILLNNWCIIDDEEKYTSPQNYFLRFIGISFGHPAFEDGTAIKTGRIISYKNGVFTTGSGSQYILGKVNDEYEINYPHAYSQLVEMAEQYLQEGRIK